MGLHKAITKDMGLGVPIFYAYLGNFDSVNKLDFTSYNRLGACLIGLELGRNQ